MTAPLSLTAYAKRRGVSAVAVSKAVAAGRLSASVVRDERGAPKIGDVDLADREWSANTRTRIDHPPPAPVRTPDAQRRRPQAAPEPSSALDPYRVGLDDVPDYNTSRAKREAAAARRESATADLTELDLAERRGELVGAGAARAEVIERFTIVKTRILGVPTRVAQRLPHVAVEVVPVLDELLREALEELADDGDAD